jgi:hypothetical protein
MDLATLARLLPRTNRPAQRSLPRPLAQLFPRTTRPAQRSLRRRLRVNDASSLHMDDKFYTQTNNASFLINILYFEYKIENFCSALFFA